MLIPSLLVTRYLSLVARYSFIARRSSLVACRVRYALDAFAKSCLLPFPHGFGRLEPGGAPSRDQAGKGDHHYTQDKAKMAFPVSHRVEHGVKSTSVSIPDKGLAIIKTGLA